MVLEEQFIQKCREAFNTFDQDGSGTIDTQEMKLLLEAIGEVGGMLLGLGRACPSGFRGIFMDFR